MQQKYSTIMALPPTKIYEFIKEKHSDTYEALESAGLLKQDVSKEEFVEALEKKEQKYLSESHETPGPNLTDNIAEAMFEFWNEKGKKLANEPLQ